MSAVCNVCMNQVWRTVIISVLSIIICIIILIVTIMYNSQIDVIMSEILETRNCWKYNSDGQLNWTLIYNNTENSCVFIFLQKMFPHSIYTWCAFHVLSDVMLFIGAIYKSNLTILIYLALDAGYLGVLASFWSVAFLTERMPRMLLMIILFPMISLGLCAWMTVFGFYIKLEEKEWARIKRRQKKKKLEKILTSEWIKSHSKDNLTDSMYDLCSNSLQRSAERPPEKQKSLEEILRQELAWTLEQIGEDSQEDKNSVHELATFSNSAFTHDE